MDQSNKSKLTISISWRLVSVVLFIALVVSVVLWKPWDTTTTSTRKISVTGEATIKSEPDQYVLSPYFEYTNADRTKSTADLTVQGTAIAAKLKELGVKDEQVKSNTNGYDKYSYLSTDSTTNTLTLQYTITLTDKDIAQKVQDYMLSLKAKGQLSPQASFSDTKQKDLQKQAREKAIEDAKSKADVTAKQFGAKVGKVVTVSDGSSSGGPITYASGDAAVSAKANSAEISSLPIQVGQDDFKYYVSVEYELK